MERPDEDGRFNEESVFLDQGRSCGSSFPQDTSTRCVELGDHREMQVGQSRGAAIRVENNTVINK